MANTAILFAWKAKSPESWLDGFFQLTDGNMNAASSRSLSWPPNVILVLILF